MLHLLYRVTFVFHIEGKLTDFSWTYLVHKTNIHIERSKYFITASEVLKVVFHKIRLQKPKC